MTEQDFRRLAIQAVEDYHNKSIASYAISKDDISIVWQCRALQNYKATLTAVPPNGMYYECTYNGDKNELYVDCYKKWENFCVSFGRYDNKLSIVDESNPPAKFSVGTPVEVVDETQLFPSSQYLIDHGLFPQYTRDFFVRLERFCAMTDFGDLHAIHAIVQDVGYDYSAKRYIYIIKTDDRFFAIAEKGLARI